jgi:hypothetical protein
LEDVFPGLRAGGYHISSPRTTRYNCIAWAANDPLNWWWPVSDARFYWPPQAPRVETLDAFEAAFALSGYVVCEMEDLEPGFEKIALFADADGMPTHAARQLIHGNWTSKLGECEDIEHRLHDLEGVIYGTVARYMKRPRPSPAG